MLDGGLSNALEDRGADLSGELWTARLLRDDPGLVRAVHTAYFEAGADVASSATYQASAAGLQAAGMTRGEAEETVRRGVRVAREARDEAADRLGRTLRVAASVGPYGAVLADGSEYRGDYGLTAAQLRDFHAPRLDLLLSESPDLLGVETIPSLLEAQVLAELLTELDVPAWLSFSVADGRLRTGEPWGEGFAVAASIPRLVATGVNCCHTAEVVPALRAVAGAGVPGIAYPNGGGGWDAQARAWADTGAFDPASGPDWVAAGAAYVGGCCQVGPEQIAGLRAAVRSLSPAR